NPVARSSTYRVVSPQQQGIPCQPAGVAVARLLASPPPGPPSPYAAPPASRRGGGPPPPPPIFQAGQRPFRLRPKSPPVCPPPPRDGESLRRHPRLPTGGCARPPFRKFPGRSKVISSSGRSRPRVAPARHAVAENVREFMADAGACGRLLTACECIASGRHGFESRRPLCYDVRWTGVLLAACAPHGSAPSGHGVQRTSSSTATRITPPRGLDRTDPRRRRIRL